MTRDETGRRVLIVTASMGAGHTHAARELARRITERGHLAREIDALSLPRFGQGRALRAAYFALLRWAPSAYDSFMRGWARWPVPFERFTAAGAGGYERGLLAEIEDWQPHVVVATFDLVAQALGRLRGRGQIDVPLVTYVTDPGAHPYWISEHVDTHLAVSEETARELRALGAPGVVATGPLIAPRFDELPDRDKARAEWGLPDDATVAVVSAGSWGVGGLQRCVSELTETGEIQALALCGHNHDLARRLAGVPGCRPVGWTDRMPELMAAADVLIDNAGGLTCLEALVAGLPVVIYRPIPGHGRFNAAALARSGLAHRASDGFELRTAVQRLASPGPARDAVIVLGRGLVTADPADHVLAAAGVAA